MFGNFGRNVHPRRRESEAWPHSDCLGHDDGLGGERAPGAFGRQPLVDDNCRTAWFSGDVVENYIDS